MKKPSGKKLLLTFLGAGVLVALLWWPAQVQYHRFQRARYLKTFNQSLGGGLDLYDKMLYHQQALVERGYLLEGEYTYQSDRGPGIMALSLELFTALKEEFGYQYTYWETNFEGVQFWCRPHQEQAMQEFFAAWEAEHQDISFLEEVVTVTFVGWQDGFALTDEKLDKIEAIALRDGEIDAEEREMLGRVFEQHLQGELEPSLREKILQLVGDAYEVEESEVPEEEADMVEQDEPSGLEGSLPE